MVRSGCKVSAHEWSPSPTITGLKKGKNLCWGDDYFRSLSLRLSVSDNGIWLRCFFYLFSNARMLCSRDGTGLGPGLMLSPHSTSQMPKSLGSRLFKARQGSVIKTCRKIVLSCRLSEFIAAPKPQFHKPEEARRSKTLKFVGRD